MVREGGVCGVCGGWGSGEREKSKGGVVEVGEKWGLLFKTLGEERCSLFTP